MSLLDQHRTLCKLRGQLEWRLQNIFQNLAFNPPHAFLNKTCTGLIFFRKPLGSYSQNSLKKKEREKIFISQTEARWHVTVWCIGRARDIGGIVTEQR